MPLVIKSLINVLPVHPDKKYGLRSLIKIKGIIVHHFASDFLTIKEAASYHIKGRKWPGIGYHYVIDDAVYQTNSITTVSYHCKGKNTSTIGIAIRGDYMQKLPTPNQLQMLQDLIAELRKINATWYVAGHRAHVATSCPGDKLAAWISQRYPD